MKPQVRPARSTRPGRSLAVYLIMMLALAVATAAAASDRRPAVAIIIDDLGDRRDLGERAVALPGPVALAFLPDTPHVEPLARAAHDAGKEVMVHLPMQAKQPEPLGRHGLTLDMTREQLHRVVRNSFDAVPHARGLNNHMGSLLTRHPGHMLWLMEALEANGTRYFVDSRTTKRSVAARLAAEAGVPYLERNVFLDADPDPAAIEAELRRLVSLAETDGTAVAIGHPYPETLAVLERELPRLEAAGIRLVAPGRLIELQEQRRDEWRAYSFP